MYAARHPGDVPHVVNLAGRFDMVGGIKERFGENIEEELRDKGSIPQTVTRSDGYSISFELTFQVGFQDKPIQ